MNNHNHPDRRGEFRRIPPREGLEGVPEEYERVEWRTRLAAISLTLIAAGLMLLALWVLEWWVG